MHRRPQFCAAMPSYTIAGGSSSREVSCCRCLVPRLAAVDASAGTFCVYYQQPCRRSRGAVQAQVIASRGDDTYISSRVFSIRMEPVVIGGELHEDGFTLFIEAILSTLRKLAFLSSLSLSPNSILMPSCRRSQASSLHRSRGRPP